MTTLSLSRTAGLARANATLVVRNRLTLIYAVVLPLLPLLLLLTGGPDGGADGAGAAAIVTALMMAALFPVFYNLLSQLVTRRDELVLKRLRTGETTDAEIIASLALPGFAIAVATSVVAVPVAMLLGQPAPLNPILHAVTVVVTLLLFAAFALWTAAWTKNAEAAQITSMPVIVLAVLGQVAVGFPDSVQRFTDLTPGAAMTSLVRIGWFGFADGDVERTLSFTDTWSQAASPLLVLVAWAGLATYLARRSMHWEPRS